MRKRTFFILTAGLVLASALLFFPGNLPFPKMPVEIHIMGKKTVSERVRELSAGVHGRLEAHFRDAGLEYPPQKIALLGFKEEKLLEVWGAGSAGVFRLVKTFPILAASGVLGPKLREGDRQVPEGLYRIESLNPNSLFHVSLRVNYPNAFDRARALEEGRDNPGSDIMIHGKAASIGCLAVGDEAAEDLFVLAAETGVSQVEVILSPVDFRKRDLPREPVAGPEWVAGLYAEIRKALAGFGP